MNRSPFAVGELRDLAFATSHEWLLTNGLGGYVSSTLCGANVRRYHGLLVASLQPPSLRTVLLSSLQEQLHIGPESDSPPVPLSTNLYPNATWPDGYSRLLEFRQGNSVVWRFEAAPGIELEREVCMPAGANAVQVRYTLHGPADTVASIQVTPLLAGRGYHTLLHASGEHPAATWSSASETLECLFPEIPGWWQQPITMGLAASLASGTGAGADYTEQGCWFYRFQYPCEQARGFDFEEDLWSPGTLTVGLAPERSVILRAWCGSGAAPEIIAPAPPEITTAPNELTSLHHAAEQFLVQVPQGRATVIAGYHWFEDWSRDTLISLAGLAETVRGAELSGPILRTFASFSSQGMLPNRFPDAGDNPEYNTVDGALWFFVALHRYMERFPGPDADALRHDLWPMLKETILWHVSGTRFGIHTCADGLLRAGEAGTQLTWMDAVVNGQPVTPRNGKPVEVNALWIAALEIAAGVAESEQDAAAASEYRDRATLARNSFLAGFPRRDGRGLYDLLEPPDRQPDASIRPNQLFALSLPFAPVSANSALAHAILETVRTELLTDCGLRTLSPSDAAYRGRYEGDAASRDGAYHQGTVWPWLLGPFAEAHYRVTGSATEALELLRPLLLHMHDCGSGTLCEIYDGDAPRRPNGCIAQAWSIAELLRVQQLLQRATEPRQA
ncbi:MAG: glycogen debranching enzyme family protein [Armatimonadetes bacterium]|nr:glycogen debranching enzyme family protein [Armatimonadota bacterium]MDE2205609.1 glycogen debranching enzyme family protein [Armatimonadota bacterium]